MPILGDVRQERKETEGASHMQGLGHAQPIQRGLEFAVRLQVVVASETHAQLTNSLNQLINLSALLRPNRVAQNTTEQSNIFTERQIFVRRTASTPQSARDSSASRCAWKEQNEPQAAR